VTAALRSNNLPLTTWASVWPHRRLRLEGYAEFLEALANELLA